MPDIDNLIKRLDQWLQANRSDYYAQLREGANSEEIAALESALSVDLPLDFQLFLQWQNGQILPTPASAAKSFYTNFILLDSQAIIKHTGFLKGLLDDGTFALENWWNPNWIPFMYDFTGNYICIDTEGAFEGTKGQILLYWHDEESRNIQHESFYKWLETTVLAMEEDVMVYDAVGDYADYSDLLEGNNPGYPIKKNAG